MIGWLLPYIIGGIGAASALLLALFAARKSGEDDARQETALEAAERMAATRQRMDKADEEPVSDDPSVLRDFLRARGDQ